MIRFALTLVFGMMLSVSGSAWATTFKDGVISSDNVVEKPKAESTITRKTGLSLDDIERGYWCVEYHPQLFPMIYFMRDRIFRSCGKKSASIITLNEIHALLSERKIPIEYFCRASKKPSPLHYLRQKFSLDCGIGESDSTQVATTSTKTSGLPACPSSKGAYLHNCFGTWTWSNGNKYTGEWKDSKRHGQGTFISADGIKDVGAFKDGVLNGFAIRYFADGTIDKEGFWKDDEFQYAKKLTPSPSTTEVASSTNTQANIATSAELKAAQSIAKTTTKSAASSAELDADRKKRLQLEQELAALKAQQEQQQQNIASDGQPPVLTAQANVEGSMALIFGSAADNVGVAELLIDGLPMQLSSDGSFETSLYVPRNGKQVEVTVFDLKGNQTDKTLSLQRSAVQQASGPVFGSLNPSGKRVMPNNDALALIIGVADYERTPAKAAYADKDAQTFYDYAMLKLGIPASNIKELVNGNASEIDVRLAVKDWIARSIKQNASDVYVFFAGHGLASQSGEEMYLLPYDGEPRLLEDSAIRRTRLFDDIAAANPRSVTVFLDTCYSGTTRGTDMLIASRPIAIKALKQSVPEGFTVMTAAAGDQTAKPLEEAKHGMFSYFLMKGMEGDADANQDNQITAGELHAYVQQNVIQQSSGSQTPELQGDADRVLVRFQ